MTNNRKNIVLVTKDVLRRDYLRCYNPNSIFNTKNIDKLAKEGFLFERTYCQVAVLYIVTELYHVLSGSCIVYCQVAVSNIEKIVTISKNHNPFC